MVLLIMFNNVTIMSIYIDNAAKLKAELSMGEDSNRHIFWQRAKALLANRRIPAVKVIFFRHLL